MRRLLLGVLILTAVFAVGKDKTPQSSKQKDTAKQSVPAAPDKAPEAKAPSQSANSGDNPTPEKPGTYSIGESDVLAIDVWHEPEISRTVSVRLDGKISLPLVGDIQAAGLTPDQLQDAITEQLKRYLDRPEVTVIVQDARSKYFSIVGEVMKPGAYPLGQQLSVLEGLALAGGFKDFANVKKIYVLRVNKNGTTTRIEFNYRAALNGDASKNFPLQPRDTIVIP